MTPSTYKPCPRRATSGRRETKTVVAILTATTLATTLITPSAAQAQRRGEPQLQVSYVTDGSLTCEQLTVEIATVAQIAGIAAQNAQNAENQGAMANIATSVAINGALYSGALGAVPGLGLFANAAGAMARRNAEARARAEAERIRIAEQRHSLLTGIYQGRQCGAPPTEAAAIAVAAPVEAAPTIAAEPVVEVEAKVDAVSPASGD